MRALLGVLQGEKKMPRQGRSYKRLSIASKTVFFSASSMSSAAPPSRHPIKHVWSDYAKARIDAMKLASDATVLSKVAPESLFTFRQAVAALKRNEYGASNEREGSVGAYQRDLVHLIMATPCPPSTKLLITSLLSEQALLADEVAIAVAEAYCTWLKTMPVHDAPPPSAAKAAFETLYDGHEQPSVDALERDARIDVLRATGAWFEREMVAEADREAFTKTANELTVNNDGATQAQILIHGSAVTPCPAAVKMLVYMHLTRHPKLAASAAIAVGEAYTAWLQQRVADSRAGRKMRMAVHIQGDAHMTQEEMLARVRAAAGDEGENLMLGPSVTYLCDVTGCKQTFDKPGHLDGFACRACDAHYDSCQGDAHTPDQRRTCPLCASQDTYTL
jgi:hypothetical protein